MGMGLRSEAIKRILNETKTCQLKWKKYDGTNVYLTEDSEGRRLGFTRLYEPDVDIDRYDLMSFSKEEGCLMTAPSKFRKERKDLEDLYNFLEDQQREQ